MFLGQTSLTPNFFWTQNFFKTQIFLGRNICGPAILLDTKYFSNPKLFWTQNFLRPQIFFLTQNFFPDTNFFFQNKKFFQKFFFRQKNFVAPNFFLFFFRHKTYLGPKYFGPIISLNQKFSDPKFIRTHDIFLDQIFVWDLETSTGDEG